MDRKEQDGISLIDKVIDDDNLWDAFKKVTANKGVSGVDGIKVNDLESHMRKYYQALKRKLKDGTYKPQPVKRVPIPKPDGSKRYLGIPCILDRVLHQAIFQVVDPKLRSYGLDHDNAMMLANSRKGNWRISCSEILHQTITKKRLTKWGLNDFRFFIKSDTSLKPSPRTPQYLL
ncbi:hypothetical protein RZN25_02010 [Bacillaceae bacterium S4-13-56]